MREKRDPVSTIVEGQLFLGDRHAAADLDLLRSLGVTHIVNCAKEQPNFHPGMFHYYNCYLRDTRRAQIDFEGPLAFIEAALDQGGVVFVHCMQGKSRSVSIVVAYLMRAYGMGADEALQHVMGLRTRVKPNGNFLRQLQGLEAGGAAHGEQVDFPGWPVSFSEQGTPQDYYHATTTPSCSYYSPYS